MSHQIVILAAGESSRFFPLNRLHKSFFKIAGKTILEWTVESAKKTNPKNIIIVLGNKNFDKEKKICENSNIFEGVIYVKQEKPLGAADAILSAVEHINENFFVLNPQHFEFDQYAETFLSKLEEKDYFAVFGSIETSEPQKYGILSFNEGEVNGIIEKPEEGKEPSKTRLVGIYLFANRFLEELKKVEISEYSLEETLNILARNGKVGTVELDTELPSLKYVWDVLHLKDLLLVKMEAKIDPDAIIENTAIIRGENVFINKNAHICDFSIIEGPAYIGENAIVGAFSQIRAGSVLEDGAQVERYCDIRNSYIGENTHIHSGFVGDSVIGKDCRIGAEFITANKRLDRKKVNYGVIIGDNVKAGIRVSTMPETNVGSDSVIYPGIILKGTYEEESNISG